MIKISGCKKYQFIGKFCLYTTWKIPSETGSKIFLTLSKLITLNHQLPNRKNALSFRSKLKRITYDPIYD